MHCNGKIYIMIQHIYIYDLAFHILYFLRSECWWSNRTFCGSGRRKFRISRLQLCMYCWRRKVVENIDILTMQSLSIYTSVRICLPSNALIAIYCELSLTLVFCQTIIYNNQTSNNRTSHLEILWADWPPLSERPYISIVWLRVQVKHWRRFTSYTYPNRWCEKIIQAGMLGQVH